MPQPVDGKRSTLLANHVQGADLYHQLRIRHACLVLTLTGQQGITINGLPPGEALKDDAKVSAEICKSHAKEE